MGHILPSPALFIDITLYLPLIDLVAFIPYLMFNGIAAGCQYLLLNSRFDIFPNFYEFGLKHNGFQDCTEK